MPAHDATLTTRDLIDARLVMAAQHRNTSLSHQVWSHQVDVDDLAYPIELGDLERSGVGDPCVVDDCVQALAPECVVDLGSGTLYRNGIAYIELHWVNARQLGKSCSIVWISVRSEDVVAPSAQLMGRRLPDARSCSSEKNGLVHYHCPLFEFRLFRRLGLGEGIRPPAAKVRLIADCIPSRYSSRLAVCCLMP